MPDKTRGEGAFESQHQIELPDDYKCFLTHIGNGGAGPHYGLFRLGEFGGEKIGTLSVPFPHVEHWNPADAYFAAHHEPVREKESRADYQTFQDRYFDPVNIEGALRICHEGCGYFDLLVVSGKEKGNMWIDGRVSDGGIAPLSSVDRNRLTFIDWYCGWLDRSTIEVGLNP